MTILYDEIAYAAMSKDNTPRVALQAAQESRVTVRTLISEKLLNDKIMERLKTRPTCRDARSVMLDFVGGELPSDWPIYHFDPGTGDRYACKVALRAIEAELRPEFGMIGRS